MIFYADSEKNIWEEKIAARKLEGETFTSQLSDLSFIVGEQFKSCVRYAVSELILCVHNK